MDLPHRARLERPVVRHERFFAGVLRGVTIDNETVGDFIWVAGIREAQSFVGHELGQCATNSQKRYDTYLDHLGNRVSASFSPPHVWTDGRNSRFTRWLVATSPLHKPTHSPCSAATHRRSGALCSIAGRTYEVEAQYMTTRLRPREIVNCLGDVLDGINPVRLSKSRGRAPPEAGGEAGWRDTNVGFMIRPS